MGRILGVLNVAHFGATGMSSLLGSNPRPALVTCAGGSRCHMPVITRNDVVLFHIDPMFKTFAIMVSMVCTSTSVAISAPACGKIWPPAQTSSVLRYATQKHGHRIRFPSFDNVVICWGFDVGHDRRSLPQQLDVLAVSSTQQWCQKLDPELYSDR